MIFNPSPRLPFCILFASVAILAPLHGSLDRPAAPVPADLRNPFAPPGRAAEPLTPAASPLERAVVAVQAWHVEGYVNHPASPSRSSAVVEGRMLRVGVAIPAGEMGVEARICLKALTTRGAELEVSAAGETASVTLPLPSR